LPGVLQCVAACCSVLQRVTVTTFERAIARCVGSVLQCIAICCSIFQCAVAVCCSSVLLQCAALCCSVLHCVAVCCSMLWCVAVTTFENAVARFDAVSCCLLQYVTVWL